MLRDPLVQFFIAAAAIFGLYSLVSGSQEKTVLLSAQTRQALIENFEALTGETATPAQKERLIRDYVLDELLLREAIDRGMHLTDSQTRKHLSNALRRLYAGEITAPSEADLVNFYADQIEDYRSEPAITFRQVFLEAKPSEPVDILETLRGGGSVAGQPYWMGDDFEAYGESMIRGVFGQPFLTALKSAEFSAWHGPIETSRGYHYVLKTNTDDGRLVPFAQVRDQVEQDYWTSKTQARFDVAIEALKEKFDVVIHDE
ncbi:MAG: peptidylprolyl isomerase [Pseudomonadota bacterium]